MDDIISCAAKQIEMIRVRCEDILPQVAVLCTTYNHEAYVKEALEGFVMQNTNFPFVVIIHDDASTDNTVAIIKEYKDKYPEIFQCVFEEENQYSKPRPALGDVLNAQLAASGAKYIAWCEGDDYWTDPNKLQMQFDFMESHPDYSMCVTNASGISALNGLSICEYRALNTSGNLELSSLIIEGGGFIATCTFMFRFDLYKSRPQEMNYMYVGDYPIQIYMGIKGKVWYFDAITAHYRVGSIGSLTRKLFKQDFKKARKNWNKQFEIYEFFDNYSRYAYHTEFEQAKTIYLFSEYIRYNKYSKSIKYWIKTANPIKRYGWSTLFKILRISFIYRWLKCFCN